VIARAGAGAAGVFPLGLGGQAILFSLALTEPLGERHGIVFRPHLVREVRSPDNRTVIQSFAPQRQREIPISPSTLSIIREGMRLAVTSGTCSQLARLPVPIAGKTGTAQTRSNRYEEASQHGWFIGYAPYDGPPDRTVIVVVFVEYGRGGAAAAVPVAYRIFSKMVQLGYF
jgi:cell division protein FtsI/penicillin-binding protein 2